MIVYRNSFVLTKVNNGRARQFAFGMLQEETPRVCFIPHWIVNAFEINQEDIGAEFDCLFVEQDKGNPMVVGIVAEGDDLKASVPVGTFELTTDLSHS